MMFEDMIFHPPMNEDEVELLPLFSVDDESEDYNEEIYPDTLPVLALKNTVLFPGIVIPITVGRDKSIKAVMEAYNADKFVGVLAQKDTKEEYPTPNDLFEIGTIAKIVKLLKMPDGTTTAILQGRRRMKIKEFVQTEPYFAGKYDIKPDVVPHENKEFEAIISSVKEMAFKIIRLSPNIPSEASLVLKNINNKSFLINFIASNLSVNIPIKQSILEIDELRDKAIKVLGQMDNELQILELKDKIETKVRGDIEKQQKEYFLNQQLKTIQEELGQNPQEEEIAALAMKGAKKNWSKEVRDTFNRELNKLKRVNPAVAEYSVTLNYLELLVDLPFQEYTKDNFNLKKASRLLDKDHYGLKKVKERILEHLAVLKLKGDMKAPILCLVGPPGVGKTSLGKSVAKALNRKYVRMSLGGLHDESEIRGHRKTYIGAMPGRIIQSLRKVKSNNPVFILDEIDKVGKDFRGDPSSALLEVMDPEQNSTFYDNYLEVEYDLSKVLFIATANSLSTIQPALLDRMEIIHVSGYSVEEKVEIAKRHLISQQRDDHGLKSKDVKINKSAIIKLIEDYTRESGVRELNRQVANLMRAIAKKVAMEEKYSPTIGKSDITSLLGPKKYSADAYYDSKTPGVAVGLAWTSVGGDILFTEASLSPGKGILTLTGNLGDVMKESATTALSFLKANSENIGVDPSIFANNNIHIHVPAGAIPKDGPSAGITMLSALTSALTKRPLKPYLAMTGEITLRGKVLPVGGIKEKILAAKRAGIKEVILCRENERDILEINPTYIAGMKFHYVTNMLNVLDLALQKDKSLATV